MPGRMILLICILIMFLCGCAGVPEATQALSVSTPAPAIPAGSVWDPMVGESFQLQFTGETDLSMEADVYDLDLFDTEEEVIDELHAGGSRVVCYISVGSWEDWRPDADQFPVEVIGNNYEGWPGEKWLDIRRIDLLSPILRARFDLCAAKGFDGIEPDNIEIHDNDSGFPISYQDQLAFALWLAEEAHERSLAIGLKNAPDMAADLVNIYDFSVLEDCFAYGWCADLQPFIDAGKPVFAIEYTDMRIDFEAACAEADALGLTMILKHRDLDSFRRTCP